MATSAPIAPLPAMPMSIAFVFQYAVAMAVMFEVFFVRLLKVQMPAGVLKPWLF